MAAAIVAIIGFYFLMIVAIVKMSDLLKARAGQKALLAEIEQLKAKIAVLEQEVGLMESHVLELKDGHEFAMKLLSDKNRAANPPEAAEKAATR